MFEVKCTGLLEIFPIRRLSTTIFRTIQKFIGGKMSVIKLIHVHLKDWSIVRKK